MKNKLLTIGLFLFTSQAFAEEKVEFIDFVHLCINGVSNVKYLSRDSEFLGAQEMKESNPFKKELTARGYKGMLYTKSNKKIILYFGEVTDRGKKVGSCGVISDHENYNHIFNKIKNGYDVKLVDKIKMGPGVQYLYEIKTGGDTTLSIQQLTGKKEGSLRYDLFEFIK